MPSIGFVEKYIEEQKEKYIDAYLRIDVHPKTGNEISSVDFDECLKDTNIRTGVAKYFNNHSCN